jgi:predicted anti-sigma-YlaC factor YlaD
MSPEHLAATLTHLPRPSQRHRVRWHQLARCALAAVGVAQAGLGVMSLVLAGGHAAHSHMAMGAGIAHMSHESSSWNLALGVAFLVGAWWTRHLAGTLPVLASFALVLAVVSAVDLASGAVEPARVTSHLLILVGLGLIVLIVATRPAEPRPGPATHRSEHAYRPASPGSPVRKTELPPSTERSTGPDPAARRPAA